jgi:hypothetical protein
VRFNNEAGVRIKIRDFLIDMFDFFTTKRLFSFLGKNWVVVIAFAIMACVICFYYYQFLPYDLSKDFCINTTGDEADCLSKDAARWGTFGDFFGGTLNPILSFLALIVLLRTFSMQREELNETKVILKEQSENQKRKQFESVFFKLLKVHNRELEKLLLLFNSTESHVFKTIFSQSNLQQANKCFKALSYSDSDTAKKLHDCCASYFRVLYQLLKFVAINSDNEITEVFSNDDVERNDVTPDEKMYSNIVRALLTNDVIKLLAINCYCKNEDKGNYHKYKSLIERYAFFEHSYFNIEKTEEQLFNEGFIGLIDDKLIQDITMFYDKKSFGESSSQNQETS